MLHFYLKSLCNIVFLLKFIILLESQPVVKTKKKKKMLLVLNWLPGYEVLNWLYTVLGWVWILWCWAKKCRITWQFNFFNYILKVLYNQS